MNRALLTALLGAVAWFASSAAAQTEPLLSGTFIQLDGQLASFDEEAWLQELHHMQAIGFDTVIVQYSRYGVTNYYPVEGVAAPGPSDLPPDEGLATLHWQAPSGTNARYLRIEVQPNSREWTMIPELRVHSAGTNIAAGRAYRLSPAPDARYADAQAPGAGKLTDGLANYSWTDMVGWVLPGDRIRIDVDLGNEQAIDAVEVLFMRSDISSVELPSGYTVATSGDGEAYVSLGESASWQPSEIVAREPLRHLLAAAEKSSFEVWLGLGLDPTFWQGKFDAASSAAENIALMLRLEALYGASPALVGWYLPEELDDRSFVSEGVHQDVIAYLGAMADAAHQHTGRPVMVAPYFGINPDATAFAAWWDVTLAGADLDVIALQDGVGTRRTTTEEGVPVYAALAAVAAKHGVELWSDLEVFEQTHGWPVDDGAWQARSADSERVLHQLQLEAPYVSKFVVFDFASYMSPRLGGRAGELYRGYQAYLTERGEP